jgi:hypothetical protein
MYETLPVEIVGSAPLILHNGQTADPLNKFARALKEVSGKRKKTEADFEEMARIEFMSGLYMGPDGPVLPTRLLESAIIEGARKSKLGKLAQAGMMIEKSARLDYEGPRGSKELFEDERFRFAVPVRVGQAKVIRTRPMFENWSAEFVVTFDAEILNGRDLLTAIRQAGMFCGVGDWRPRHGRFALRQDM